MIGAWVWGLAGDIIGRYKSYALVLTSLIIFGYTQLFIMNTWTLLLMRFLMGFAVGGVFLGYAIFAEFLPTESRSMWLNVFQAFFALGSMLAAILAYVLLERLGWSWRMLIVIGSFPTILSFSFVPWLPESVRYLSLHGREEDLVKIFHKISKWNNRPIPKRGFRLLLHRDDDGKNKASGWEKLKKIFNNRFLRCTLVLFVTWFNAR